MKVVGSSCSPTGICFGFAIVLKVILLLTCLGESKGQALTGYERQAIIDKAQTQLETMSKEGGEIYAFVKKNNVIGNFTFDLTLSGKGNVLTLFMVESSSDVKNQNLIKAKLTEIKFEDVKIPKNQRIKFRYTLNF